MDSGIIFAQILFKMFSTWSYERNGVWHNDMTLWADSAKISPNKARPHTNLGVALWQRGKTKEAMDQYSKALRINPN
jgi:tetratricopeptide (TPR) repeat protein